MQTDTVTEAAPAELSIEQLQGNDWEDVLERFTEDMDPWAIDIVELADRYRSYIRRRERMDLEVPARMVVICSVLLKLKVRLLHEQEQDEPEEPPEEEFHEDEMAEQDWDEERWEDELQIPDETLEPPVNQIPRRRVSIDELKDALDSAVSTHKRRKQRRQQRREQESEEFIEIQENNIQDKLDSLMDRLTSFFSREEDQLTFDSLLERDDSDERIEKFVHLLHLETEDRVRCRQEEFFGEIEIVPQQDAA